MLLLFVVDKAETKHEKLSCIASKIHLQDCTAVPNGIKIFLIHTTFCEAADPREKDPIRLNLSGS